MDFQGFGRDRGGDSRPFLFLAGALLVLLPFCWYFAGTLLVLLKSTSDL
jgi:hypothetical protein